MRRLAHSRDGLEPTKGDQRPRAIPCRATNGAPPWGSLRPSPTAADGRKTWVKILEGRSHLSRSPPTSTSASPSIDGHLRSPKDRLRAAEDRLRARRSATRPEASAGDRRAGQPPLCGHRAGSNASAVYRPHASACLRPCEHAVTPSRLRSFADAGAGEFRRAFGRCRGVRRRSSVAVDRRREDDHARRRSELRALSSARRRSSASARISPAPLGGRRQVDVARAATSPWRALQRALGALNARTRGEAHRASHLQFFG